MLPRVEQDLRLPLPSLAMNAACRLSLSLLLALTALPHSRLVAQAGWSDRTTLPHPEWVSCACYDPVRQTVVVFRHFGGTMTVAEFDGTNWSIAAASGYPSIGSLAGGWAACDPVAGTFLLTMTSNNFETQTVTWDRTSWVLRGVSAAPSSLMGLVWHAGRGTFVGLAMTGVGTANSALRLYEWNGASWVQRTARTMPVTGGSLAYHGGLGELVVLANNGSQNATFRVDLAASSWQQVPHPTLDEHHLVLSYDQVQGRLFGFANTFVHSTYEFTGTGWETHVHGATPPYNAGYGLVFVQFPPQDGFVLVQNQPFHAQRCATYLYRPAARRSPTFGLHHPGCIGTTTPAIGLAAGTSPRLGQPFGIQVSDLSPTGSLVFLTSGFTDDVHQGNPLPFEMSAYGLPGCYLNIACRITDSAAAQAGVAHFHVPLPLNLDYLGLRFFHQALVVDPQLPNPLGAILTDSLTGTVGW